MRILILIFAALFFLCCKKSNDAPIKLLRTQSTAYTGNVLNTEYGYDNSGRITTITQYLNNAQPVVAVSISYNGNEAKLLSFPDTEPLYNQTKEVRLTLDASGRMLKRIEYTHGVSKLPGAQPPQTFKYDTLLCEYDAAGLLKKTAESRYDSTWVSPGFNSVRRLTSTTSFSTNAGNLVSSDEYTVYPAITRDGGITTISGGSSEYHNSFNYTKSFPNQTDFTNAAVLNEGGLYDEPPLNINYKNMTDQAVRKSVDRDINGTVIFTGDYSIDMERFYNADGLLSSVKIPSQNTQYKEINFFYGK